MTMRKGRWAATLVVCAAFVAGCGGDDAPATITVTSPTAAASFYGSATLSITWTSSGVGGNVDIKFHDGTSWSSVILGTANDGAHDWRVPDNVTSANCRVRVSAISGGAVGESDEFSVSPGTISITAPTGASNWDHGSTVSIQWTAQGPERVRIDFSRDGSFTDGSTIAWEVDASLGNYDWTIDVDGGDSFYIRVMDRDNSQPQADSAAFVVRQIKVLTPAGGDGWVVGSSAEISWSSIGVTSVDISMYQDGAWKPLALGYDAALSPYTYDPVALPLAGDCLIRVKEASGTLADETDAPFSVWDGNWKVKADAAGAGTGFTWADAFLHPQDALDAAAADPLAKEIWVAAVPSDGSYLRTAGTYVVDIAGDGIELYGGFAGIESSRGGRDTAANVTRLDGDGAYQVLNCDTHSNVVVDGFTIQNGSASYAGAGYFAGCASPTLHDMTVSANEATSFAGCMMLSGCTDSVITDCTFSSNTGPTGAGLNITSSTGTVSGCTFTGNVADAGGACWLSDCSLLTFDTCAFSTNSAANYGGALASDNAGTRAFTGCVFDQNTSSGDAGALWVRNADQLDLTDCTFSLNDALGASGRGGAIKIQATAAVTVSGSTAFTDNTAYDGGGLHVESSPADFTGTTFTGNVASNDAGAIHCNSALSLDGCEFTSNVAAVDGGAIAQGGGSITSVNGTTFTSNQATTGDGGAIRATSLDSLLDLDGTSFDSDTAGGSGGGIHHAYASECPGVLLTACSFTQCTAQGAGGYYNSGTDVTISGCTFSQCVNATSNGGGALIGGDSLALTDTLFELNEAYSAAGIDIATTTATVTGCVFDSNMAADDGAGMSTDSLATVARCLFVDNGPMLSADVRGAGASVFNTDAVFENCVFNNNDGYQGGGLYLYNANADVIHCTFSNCDATYAGGAIYYNNTAIAVVENSILYGNSGTGAEIYDEGNTGTRCTVSSSDIHQLPGTNYTDGGDNIDANPAFVAADLELHLDSGSPCIDACAVSSLATAFDYDGDSRPIDADSTPSATEYDMGADER